MSAVQAPTPVSQIIANGYRGEFGPGNQCRVTRVTLHGGLDIVRWQSTFAQAVELPLQDDSERIHFSFTHRLKGKAHCSFHDGRRHTRHAINEGAGSISFGRSREGLYHQQGEIDNITVMINPQLLAQWDVEIDPILGSALACEHCFLDGYRSGEMSATAHLLCNAMDLSQPRSSLWLYGQSVTLVSLFLQARRNLACTCRLSPLDRQRLLRAREYLLADLGKAPSLPALAREAGMSQPKLTRGFRQLFANSVYGVFQQARMAQARSRLMEGEASVMRVASDLGYANASHFATAFRKQFGINPSSFKAGAGHD
ncbi:AraC family transcriptional regulator [Pseudomonas sp. Marseille-Q1929]|uniref:helix-turn-helix domain-containing protein n=1 Tax=Pseudomonas sp. Marseille-Q1929 TaxID=2730402 RepID=UPI001A8CFC5F|nr:AraC family transcriptional regulator [Pseudomonas sp. Marseille-Q1929]MBO0493906.1 helix-turn-helix transcriptional regulator [Pseudomonas sp. Marseille-Q1929]